MLKYTSEAVFRTPGSEKLSLWRYSLSPAGPYPWFPEASIPVLAVLATAAEVLFALCLLLGGFLLLLFALSMSFSIGIKAPLDYSVFTASAAAFALSLLKDKFLEIDSLIANR